jgi:tetratricopeptide (TPR) repeat protein
MNAFLRHRRLNKRIDVLRAQLAEGDPERMPLDFARLARELADLYAEYGRKVDAIRWYGQSIDAYLYAGFAEAAIAMCRKVIQFEPRVVRARATLAMLYLARSDEEKADEEIRMYVGITRERGVDVQLTCERLRACADLTGSIELKTRIADAIADFGAAEMSQEIRREVKRVAGGGCGPSLSEAERWRLLIDATVGARAVV